MTPKQVDDITSHVATLHFAVRELWVREFRRSKNPIGAATTYTNTITDSMPISQDPGLADAREKLISFFEGVVAELRSSGRLRDA
jgi:hypothetical protein